MLKCVCVWHLLLFCFVYRGWTGGETGGLQHGRCDTWSCLSDYNMENTLQGFKFNSIQHKDEIFYVFFVNIHSELWIWCLLSKNVGTFWGLGTDGTIFWSFCKTFLLDLRPQLLYSLYIVVSHIFYDSTTQIERRITFMIKLMHVHDSVGVCF